MANRYKRKDVLDALYNKALGVCDNSFTSRPVATDKMDTFIVVSLPQGIDPYADTHNTAYVQFHCYARDRQGGVVNENALEELVDGIVNLFPFNDSLMSCNASPIVLGAKSDGLGFHSVIIQTRLVIKF